MTLPASTRRGPVRPAAILVLALGLIGGMTPAMAAPAIADNDTNGHANDIEAIDPKNKYTISLDPGPAATLRADNGRLTDAELNTFKAAHADWTFLNAPSGAMAGQQLPGTFTVTAYDAYKNDPPASFVVEYDSGVIDLDSPPPEYGWMSAFLAPVPNVDLHWAQLVDTNAPCKAGLPRPYVDPQCMVDTNGDQVPDGPDDDLPFYWTSAEHGSAGSGNYQETTDIVENTVRIQMRFSDAPGRPLGNGTVDWRGALVVASRASTEKFARFFDVIDWGFDIVCGRAVAPPGGMDEKGGAGGDKVPAETIGEDPDPECQITKVKRAVKLKVGEVAAKGRVKAEDGLTQCSDRVPVQLLMRSGGGWKVVEKGKTNRQGRFSLDSEGPGDYRSRAKRTVRGAVDDVICSKALSPIRPGR